MRQIRTALSIVLLASGVAHAQRARATLDDSLKFSQKVYDELFDDMSLTPAQRSRAMQVLRESFVSRVRNPSPAGCTGLILEFARMDRRDSTLKAILTNAEDRARLAQRIRERHLPKECDGS